MTDVPQTLEEFDEYAKREIAELHEQAKRLAAENGLTESPRYWANQRIILDAIEASYATTRSRIAANLAR